MTFNPSAHSAQTHLHRFDDVEFDESTGTLRVAGRNIEIEPRPRELLAELLRRPDEVVSRGDLMESLWEGRTTVDNVLANAVNKLRRALGTVAAARLVTVPRIGYRLTGPFERVVLRPREAPPISLTAGEPVPGRPDMLLDRPLGRGQVWRALDRQTGAARVFKFAFDAERLTALKREYTFYRVLRAELGDRDDFARVVSAQFATSPFHLECEDGGVALDDWAKPGDRLAMLPRDARLALFMQVARSVAAAHAIGLLHKDLKPANVLVAAKGQGDDEKGDDEKGDDEGWVTRLTDFGSSRLLDPARLAQLGVTAMGLTLTQGVDATLDATPLYLAPELLAGRAPSMQSDLYALGIMLFQLLVGDLRRTMATGWEREIDDPLLREDLIAATEGRPEDRLASVAELVERLSTLDARRAAQAQARAAAERARDTELRWQRARARRPWIYAAFASLAVGLAASLWFFAQADAALRRARADAALARSTSDFLTQDVFETRDAIYAGNFRNVSMLDVMRRAAARAGARFASQPRAEAAVRFQLAGIYVRMTALQDAYAELKAGDDVLAAAGIAPADGQRLALRLEMARALARSYSTKDAAALLQQAERDAGPTRLAGNDELGYRALRARVSLNDNDRSDAAAERAERLAALADRIAPDDTQARLEAREMLAELRIRRGETDSARTVLAAMQQPPFNADDATVLVDARVRMTIAGSLIEAGRYTEAEAELLRARQRVAQAFGERDFHVGKLNSELGALYETQGDFRRAAESLRRALAIFDSTLGPDHRTTRVAMANLAGEELNLGHAAEALGMLDAQRDWLAAHSRTGKSATTDFDRARALTSLGRPAEALKVLDTLKSEDFDDGTRESGWRWKLQAERGRALLAAGQRQQGQRLLQDALPALERDHALPWVVASYREAVSR